MIGSLIGPQITTGSPAGLTIYQPGSIYHRIGMTFSTPRFFECGSGLLAEAPVLVCSTCIHTPVKASCDKRMAAGSLELYLRTMKSMYGTFSPVTRVYPGGFVTRPRWD